MFAHDFFEYDDYYAAGTTKVFDSMKYAALDYRLTDGVTIEHWLNYTTMLANYDTWLSEIEFPWKPLIGIVGVPWPRWSSAEGGHCGDGFFDTYTKTIDAENLPIQIMSLTAANELITDGKKVVGVVGVCDDGTTYNVSSDRGVILATGGFSGNSEMLLDYNMTWDWEGKTALNTTNAYGHTGDGIAMALSADAQLDTDQSF